MSTVPAPTTKSNKAYFCTYLGISGILTRPGYQVLFLEPESREAIALSPEEVLRDVVMNGEVGTVMAQWLEDVAAGSATAQMCGRPLEVEHGNVAA